MTKKYKDFLNSLSLEDYEQIRDKAQTYLELNQKNITYTSNSDALGNQSFSIALGTSLALLEKYHEWLKEDPVE